LCFYIEKSQNKGPTKREIEEHKERTLKKLLDQAKKDEEEVDEVAQLDVNKEFVNENYIKMQNNNTFSERGIDVIDVSGVEGALSGLFIDDSDKHPEKRMKAVKMI
jgi:hypothetical protein